MSNKREITTIRMWIVAGGIFVFGLMIAIQLVKIQVFQGEHYRGMAEKAVHEDRTIPATRGNLYDAQGNLLAITVPKYDIRFDAVTVYKQDFDDNVGALSEALATKFGKSKTYYNNLLRKARQNKNRYLLLARDLKYSDYLEVKEFPLLEKGAYRGGRIVERKLRREHPLGKMAERTVGYERKDDEGNYSRAGMEGSFTALLSGTDGKHSMQKIARGQWKPVTPYPEVEPKDGYDVYTTIDVNIQDIAHHALLRQLEKFEGQYGTAVVMEVATGEIKAMANLARTDKGKYYEKLNYAVGATMEPGSTFKLMALVQALEDKVIDTSTVVDTRNGTLKKFGKTVRDSRRGGYGKISAAKAFEESSNTAFVQLIDDNYRNNPEKFVEGLRDMHLASKSGIPLIGEGEPKIPHPDDSDWSKISLSWMSFGYGVSMTPLQTLTFYNAIANNGVLVRPRLLRESRDWDGTVERYEREVLDDAICSQETVNKVRAIMENTVKRGTAENIYTPDFSMAGKTGTAKTEYWLDGPTQYVASFAGYFPADKPKYSCIVVVNKPNSKLGYYGSEVAAPVFREIAVKIYSDTPIQQLVPSLQPASESQVDNYEAYLAQVNDTKRTVPNVQGMDGMDAIALLENLGLRVAFEGTGKVTRQSVQKGSPLKGITEIILYLS